MHFVGGRSVSPGKAELREGGLLGTTVQAAEVRCQCGSGEFHIAISQCSMAMAVADYRVSLGLLLL